MLGDLTELYMRHAGLSASTELLVVFTVSHLSKFSVVIQIFLFLFVCYLLYHILRMI